MALSLLVMPTTSWAQFLFTTNNGTITITGYTGPGGAVAIPATTNGLPVIRIGNQAFYNCMNLAEVTIPNSVRSIGDYAFAQCSGLTNVAFGAGLQVVGSYAFYFCTRLTDADLAPGVTTIGDWAFGGSTRLTSVTLPDSITSLGANAFAGCSSLEGVAIPRGLTAIGADTFKNCISLSTIAIPDNITSLGSGAFHSCTKLTNVLAGNGLTSIGTNCFRQCIHLVTVSLGTCVTSIGDRAFQYCDTLQGVYCGGNAPLAGGPDVFVSATLATVYYLPGTAGWTATFAGRPTAPWALPYPIILSFGPGFGVQTNRFGFVVSWATNAAVIVQACTNLANATWSAVSTNTLAGGWSYFSEPQSPGIRSRFYRVRHP